MICFNQVVLRTKCARGGGVAAKNIKEKIKGVNTQKVY